MIHFACPCCKAALSASDDQASTKMLCPKCGQKLMTPPAPVPVPSLKTTLAIDLGHAANGGPPPVASLPASPIDVGEESVIDPRPPRAAHDRQYRDDRPSRRRRRRRGRHDPDAECPFCGSHEEPMVRQEMPQEGWIIFVVLLLVFFPHCWIPFVCMQKTETCYDCGRLLPVRR
jgi:DNA-directed RNA polymerase subunit RPC12/RpoP